jgi:hypothetical protein
MELAMLSRRKTCADWIKHPDAGTEAAPLDPLSAIAPLFRVCRKFRMCAGSPCRIARDVGNRLAGLTVGGNALGVSKETLAPSSATISPFFADT